MASMIHHGAVLNAPGHPMAYTSDALSRHCGFSDVFVWFHSSAMLRPRG